MAINKVIVNSETVLDLTGTTVTAADLPNGVTAVNNAGATVTGSFPTLHSASGTIASGTGVNVTYEARDDVVTITGGVTLDSNGSYSVLLPAAIRPGRQVYSHAIELDTNGNTFSNRAYVSAWYNLTVQGGAAGSSVGFTLTYILGGTVS